MAVVSLLCAALSWGKNAAAERLARLLINNVKTVAQENIQTIKQPYFLPLFFLFVSLLTMNIYGLFPGAFTPSSAFAVSFDSAVTFFLMVILLMSFSKQ